MSDTNPKNQWKEFLTTMLELDGRAQCECQNEVPIRTTIKTKSVKPLQRRPYIKKPNQ